MDARWWRLPGPAQFVRSLVQEFRAGKNLILALPRHGTSGLREALRERVREQECWRWRAVEPAELHGTDLPGLVESLHRRLAPSGTDEPECTAAALARRLPGTIVWVEVLDGPSWPLWARLMAQYQHACQGLDEYDRGLFCVALRGPANSVPAPDAALAVRRWEGVVGRLDMMLYLDGLYGAGLDTPLHRRLATAVAVELAGYDPELARRLAEGDLARVLDPVDVLARLAADRGWCARAARDPSWQEGMCDRVEGLSFVHSAALIARGDHAEIQRRIWRGQVAVLYPYIEEQRMEILPRVRGYLRLPVETTYGPVSSAEDLEVGQLVHFLRGQALPHRTWRLLKQLTEMRNMLAHSKPVPASLLLNGAASQEP